ncbi:MAG: dihydropteroate synthase [Spirochaetales bacterium]|nr:dihydropteroate synthase [Spirochaetales bacterium]
MDPRTSPLARLEWRGRALDFAERVYVMGIVNATPDSFYPASRAPEMARALEAALGMIEAGADIIDVGGESTRPGSAPVDEAEETRRTAPLIRELRRSCGALISVDTRRRAVAEAALEAGADMVNVVGGLAENEEFASALARAGVPVVLMHMRGTPADMQKNPHYDDAVREVTGELRALMERAVECGVRRELVVLDPGIGFGKRVEDNLALLAGLDRIRALGRPVLIGVSRKSFLQAVTGRPVEDRLAGTVAANTLAALRGADILRVHDVPEAVDVARFVESVRRLP